MNIIPKLGTKESIEAFKGTIELDHEAGVGGFVSELKEMYMQQDPVPKDVLESQEREDQITKVVNLAFKQKSK